MCCERSKGQTVSRARLGGARLKALGNAVVPAQAYPILKAIAEIEGVGV